MFFKLLLLLSISSTLQAKNLLFVGDSHTSGPFGRYVYQELENEPQIDDLVVLGHASSAPIHWLMKKNIKLSGGVFNQAYIKKRKLLNPRPTHWRTKVTVPKFFPLLEDMRYHQNWRKTTHKSKPDLVVIALGANDARAIADREGNIDTYNYTKRYNYIKKMLEKIKANNQECLWIAPPFGVKKSSKNQKVLYQMIEEAVLAYCPLFNSNHYIARGCDGIHFNCSSELANAKAWAKEVSQFILKNI